MSKYKGGYNVLSAPVVNSIQMERAELERLCNEKNLPLFYLQVGETVTEGIIQSCDPYLKYFTMYGGQWFTATEKIEDKKGVQ